MDMKRIGCAVLGVVLGVAFALACPTDVGLTEQGIQCLAILILAVVWWVGSVLPTYATAIVMVVLFAVIAGVKSSVALSAFTFDTWWLLLAAFGLGAGMKVSGLLRRIALAVVRTFPNTFVAQAAGLMLAGTIVGPLVPSMAAKVSMLTPLAMGIGDELGYERFGKSMQGLFLAMFCGVAIASAFCWKLVVALSVIPDAAQSGVSIWEIVRRTTTHYPLPPIFDFASHFKGLSAFPRDPSIQLLGAIAALLVSVPFAMAARGVLAKRWNGRLLLFLAVPAYVAAVSVMNTIYTHYFLPVVTMLPVLFCAISKELDEGEEESMTWKKTATTLLPVLAVCAVAAIFLATYSAPPTVSQNFYSRIYNFPSKNVWGLTWSIMLVFTIAAQIAIWALRGFKPPKLSAVAWIAASFVAASVVFAAIPAVQLAPYMVSAVFLVAIFGKRLPRYAISVFAMPLCVLAMYVATPNWRASFAELLRPGTHYHAQVAAEIAKLVPEDAVVIGERSNQMLMSLPIRTATTFAANSDPIPVIESILKAKPDAKLYALADSQHAYNLQHYREHAKEYALQPVKTFKMPSFSTGAPADVYLCKIIPQKK